MIAQTISDEAFDAALAGETIVVHPDGTYEKRPDLDSTRYNFGGFTATKYCRNKNGVLESVFVFEK